MSRLLVVLVLTMLVLSSCALGVTVPAQGTPAPVPVEPLPPETTALAVADASPIPDGPSVTVQLNPAVGSGVTGTVVLAAEGNRTNALLDLQGLQPNTPAQATMHAATCAAPSASLTPLPALTTDETGRASGAGELVFRGAENIALWDVADGDHVIVVGQGEQTVACGVIPRLEAPTTAPTGTVLDGATEFGATPDAAPTVEAMAEDACPRPSAGMELLVQPNHGYCLVYPEQYRVQEPSPEETALVVGGILDVENPRAHIQVTDAGGRTAEEVAGQLATENAMPGQEVESSTVTVGGEQAFVVDGLAGQEINRRVLFVHDGRLYNLMFAPADPERGEVFTRMEELYTSVLESFTFLSAEEAAAAAAEPCPQPAGDTQLLRNEAHAYCMLYPAGYETAQPNPDTTVILAPASTEGHRERAFIEVLDAGGRSAEQAVEEIAQSFQIPGQEIERTFGYLLDGEPAFQLDGVPGQEISRQLVFVHAGRLYHLTFIPADPAQGEAYAQMEAVYEHVLDSFTFLPPAGE